jgi:hypothetical protein
MRISFLNPISSSSFGVGHYWWASLFTLTFAMAHDFMAHLSLQAVLIRLALLPAVFFITYQIARSWMVLALRA